MKSSCERVAFEIADRKSRLRLLIDENLQSMLRDNKPNVVPTI